MIALPAIIAFATSTGAGFLKSRVAAAVLGSGIVSVALAGAGGYIVGRMHGAEAENVRHAALALAAKRTRQMLETKLKEASDALDDANDKAERRNDAVAIPLDGGCIDGEWLRKLGELR
jgi:hypothetical protein